MKYKVYTDGSCVTKSKKGGYGVVVLSEKNSVVYETSVAYSNTTNNRMELSALLDAFKYVNANMSEEDFVEFYTDSAYISNCFEQKWYKTWLANGWRTANRLKVKNTDLWKAILHEYRNFKMQIVISKVKSHAGDTWNEYVDGLANNWRYVEDEESFIIDQD